LEETGVKLIFTSSVTEQKFILKVELSEVTREDREGFSALPFGVRTRLFKGSERRKSVVFAISHPDPRCIEQDDITVGHLVFGAAYVTAADPFVLKDFQGIFRDALRDLMEEIQVRQFFGKPNAPQPWCRERNEIVLS
jgi:hypothetical protein